MDNQKEKEVVVMNPDSFAIISPFSGRELSLQDKLQISAEDLMYYSIKRQENEIRKTDILDAIYSDTPKYRNAAQYISDAFIKVMTLAELLVEKIDLNKYFDEPKVFTAYSIDSIDLDDKIYGVFSFRINIRFSDKDDNEIISPINITTFINLKKIYFKYKKNDFVNAGNTTYHISLNSRVENCDKCNELIVTKDGDGSIKLTENTYFSDVITLEMKKLVEKFDRSLYSILHHIDTDYNSNKICEACKYIGNDKNGCNPFYENDNVEYSDVLKFLTENVDRYHRQVNEKENDSYKITYNYTTYYLMSPETDILNIVYSERFKKELLVVYHRFLSIIKDYQFFDDEYKKSIEQEVKEQNGVKSDIA